MPGSAAARWRTDLESWAVPPDLVAAAGRSPWGHDVRRFAARADAQLAEPGGPSYDAAVAALTAAQRLGAQRPTLLDVGAGAGAASLPLLRLVQRLTAVDPAEDMLGALAERAAAATAGADDDGAAREVRTVVGRWPDVASQVDVHDVVVCHHVLFDVPDVVPFVDALTGRAATAVVVEVPVVHPLSWLNPLWVRFHGLRRPDRPTVDDLVAVLGERGVRDLTVERWVTADPDLDTPEQLVERVTRRLCLPAEREPDVADALAEGGVGPDRRMATLSWAGAAA